MSWEEADLESIMARARESEGGEIYLNILTGERCRLGVCVIDSDDGTKLVLELLICVLSEEKVDLDRCYHSLDIARVAQEIGYELTSQGDGWIYCHKSVRPTEIERDTVPVARMIV